MKVNILSLINEIVEAELQNEGMFGDVYRTVSGKDLEYYRVLNDLWSPTFALAHEDFLKQNEKLLLNKDNYKGNGPLNNAALHAIEAKNKTDGVKGYGAGKTINDLYDAVVQAYKVIG